MIETQLSPKDIAEAQCSLIDYIKVSFNCQGKKFSVKPHHELIASKLEQIVIGKNGNTIINIPPRHSKTQMLSSFIEWTQGLFPFSNTIYTSYSQSLATSVSENIRNNINSDWYRQIFGDIKIDKTISSKHYWRVQRGKDDGYFIAVPTGGQITGRGAGVSGVTYYSGALVVDDPLKPSESNSELERNKVNRFFSETLFSRANNPNVPTIILMQRLHENDLTGYLLENQPDDWTHINIPALDENNEALWPEVMPLEKLEKLRELNNKVFMTQYQQTPVADGGNLFPTDMFTVSEEMPDLTNASVVIGTDFAVTDSDQADYTVFTVMAFTDKGIYVLDMYRAKETVDIWVNALVDMIEKHSPSAVYVESGVIFNSIEPVFKQTMDERAVYATIKKVTRTRDKVSVAQTLLGLYKTGKFTVHEDCQHINDLRDEMCAFPLGRNDDMVDALALPCLEYNKLTRNNLESVDINFSYNPTIF